ncbi:MAG TPA: hypothetical protein VID69_06895 [Actinomycetota bacterium]
MSLRGRVERVTLGVVFGIAAWIIERRVLASIRRRGQEPPVSRSIADQTTSELGRPQG